MTRSDEQLSRDLQSLRIDRGAGSRAPTHAPLSSESQRTPSDEGSIVGKLVKVGALVGVIALGVIGFRALRASTEASLFKTEVSFTEVGTIAPSQGQVEVTSTGYVVPQVIAKVGTKIMGRISKVGVREGGRVKAGDSLFELDPSDQRSAVAASNARVLSASAKVEAARAQLHEVEIQHTRQKELVRVGAVPASTADDLAARAATLQEQLKAQQADMVAARADVAQLAVGLAHTTVKAPIDGVAVTKPAELGDVVSPAATLVELVDFSTLVVETDVPEGRLGKIRPEGPCEIVLDGACQANSSTPSATCGIRCMGGLLCAPVEPQSGGMARRAKTESKWAGRVAAWRESRQTAASSWRAVGTRRKPVVVVRRLRADSSPALA